MLLIATNRARQARGGFNGSPGQEIVFLSGEDLAVEGAEGFRAALFTEIRRQMVEGVERPVILGVVHGFNVNWQESLAFFRRIEEFTQNLTPAPVVVGFSWPSEGLLTNYLDDRSAARHSAESFAALIMKAIRAAEVERCSADFVLLCHSMGNYLVAKAAQHAFEERGQPRSYNVFREILMVAPDLDAEVFESGGLAEPMAVFSRRVTVYSNANDLALLGSSVKRAGLSGARLGRQGPARLDRIPGNVVAIDTTAHARGLEAHSAYFFKDALIRDMVAVIRGDDRRSISGRSVVETAASGAALFRIDAGG